MSQPTGVLHSINVSNGGPHKSSVTRAWLGAAGVEGDRQRNRRIHGGVDRAVSLYSLDLILALQREGHPIRPGSIGENLTISGIDWSVLAPGVELAVGDARLQVTMFAAPCRAIADSFLGAAFDRVSQPAHPGWSRLYARVLAEGPVCTGAAVCVTLREAPGGAVANPGPVRHHDRLPAGTDRGPVATW